MAKQDKIKGITIQIGGDTTKLGKALEDATKGSESLNKELKEVDKMLKFDPSNIDLLNQKQAILTSEIDRTSDRLDVLREAQEQVQAQFDNNEIGADQYRAFQRELMQTEGYLDSLRERLAGTQTAIADMSTEVTDNRTVLEKLTDTIQEQEDRLGDLSREYQSVVLEQGANSTEARALASQMQRLNGELSDNRDRLEEAENAANDLTPALNDTGEAAGNSGDGFTVMKGVLADLTANAIQSAIGAVGDLMGSLLELTEATEEYRQMQYKLEGSAESFGYSMNFVSNKYKDLYKYVGDDQMATNAITNLLGMRLETDTLDNVVGGAIATWTAYGDSIPIESLTESIAESVNVAKVTGTLADTINWASLSNEKWTRVLGEGSKAHVAFNKALKDGEATEDAFSAALAATSDQQERANLVAGLLNETYGESKKTYDRLSGSIIETKEAELELKETQAELGETLAPVNAELTKLKNEALKATIPLVADLAEGFLDLLDQLEDQPEILEIVTGLVAGLAAGFGVLAAAMGIQALIKGVTAALGALSGALTVLSANPVMLAVAGIAAIATGLTTWIAVSDETVQAQKELTETIERETESWAKLKKAQEEQLHASLSEIDYVRQLKSELDGLVDENGKIVDGYESRATFITGELSNATGVEISIIDGVIQKYGQLAESIDLIIAKKRAQIILDSQEEAYSEAVQKRTEAITLMNQLEEEYLAAKQERDAAERAMVEAKNEWEYNAALSRMGFAEAELADKKNKLDSQKLLIKGYNDTIAQYEYDAKLIASGNADEISLINDRIKASYSDKGEQVVLTVQQQIDNEKALLEELKAAYASTEDAKYQDQIAASEARIDQLNSDLEAQRSTISQLTPTVSTAWGDMNDASVSEVKKRSPKFKTEAETQMKNVQTGVRVTAPLATQQYRKAADDALAATQKNTPQYKPAGVDTMKGVEEGVRSQAPSLSAALWEIGQSMLASLRASLDMHSPSREMEDAGIDTIDGVVLGVEKRKNLAVEAMESTGYDMIGAFDGMQLDRALAESIGGDPVAFGMRSMGESLSGRIDQLYAILAEYLPGIADNAQKQIILNDGTLVGALAPGMDAELGDMSVLKKRGG